MDDHRFDHIARAFSGGASRRQVLGLIAASVLASSRSRPAGAAQATTCQPSQTECDGVCVETCCDNRNCGACGNVCSDGLTCFEGVCDCPSGLCLPNTGQGSGAAQSGAWSALALGSVAGGIVAV